MDQKTIHYHLGKMAVLPNSLNVDLPQSFIVAQVAQKHGWAEPMVWSLAFEGKADLISFDPYFTIKAEGKGTGTGLGFSVVHGIIETHGAAIKVASLPGQGTVFSVYFPGIDLAGARSDHGKETAFLE